MLGSNERLVRPNSSATHLTLDIISSPHRSLSNMSQSSDFTLTTTSQIATGSSTTRSASSTSHTGETSMDDSNNVSDTGEGQSSSSSSGNDIQKHLQSMFYLLRPEETLKMVCTHCSYSYLRLSKVQQKKNLQNLHWKENACIFIVWSNICYLHARTHNQAVSQTIKVPNRLPRIGFWIYIKKELLFFVDWQRAKKSSHRTFFPRHDLEQLGLHWMMLRFSFTIIFTIYTPKKYIIFSRQKACFCFCFSSFNMKMGDDDYSEPWFPHRMISLLNDFLVHLFALWYNFFYDIFIYLFIFYTGCSWKKYPIFL